MDREEMIRKYILEYNIEVPEERIAEERNYIQREMRHRMQYDTLTTGAHHLFPGQELENMKEELNQAAYYEAKYDIVIRDIIKVQNFSVTNEELKEEAISMAERQNSTVDMIKRFFGEDFAMLADDVERRKAEEWIFVQAAGRLSDQKGTYEKHCR